MTEAGMLISEDQIDEARFRFIAKQRGATIARFRKTGMVAAKPVDEATELVTLWNGEETRNLAQPGDIVVTTLDADGAIMTDDAGQSNIYTMSAERFNQLYEAVEATGQMTETGSVWRAKGEIEAFFVPEGFQIKAPWGEIQTGDTGYIVLNGTDVYGVHTDVFKETYSAVD